MYKPIPNPLTSFHVPKNSCFYVWTLAAHLGMGIFARFSDDPGFTATFGDLVKFFSRPFGQNIHTACRAESALASPHSRAGAKFDPVKGCVSPSYRFDDLLHSDLPGNEHVHAGVGKRGQGSAAHGAADDGIEPGKTRSAERATGVSAPSLPVFAGLRVGYHLEFNALVAGL